MRTLRILNSVLSATRAKDALVNLIGPISRLVTFHSPHPFSISVQSHRTMHRYSRRTILAVALSPTLRTADATKPQSRYTTPHKYGQLVLASSRDSNAFDSRSVDCPFVFQDRGLFYMTYIGWDGTGYQTGLASSVDLLQWRKLGLILARDPSSPVTRYNVAMNWILREPALRSPGRLHKVHGRYLGVYHAYPNSGYESGPAVIGLC